jgi:hypothetical protein
MVEPAAKQLAGNTISPATIAAPNARLKLVRLIIHPFKFPTGPSAGPPSPKRRQAAIACSRKTAAVQLVAKRDVRFKGNRIIRVADRRRKVGNTGRRTADRLDQMIDQRRS